MNEIAAFVGPCDVAALDRASLAAAGLADGVADIAVLFGGSIVAGGDVFAEAMRAGIAHCYVIVGGAGHTTPALREAMRRLRERGADDRHRGPGVVRGLGIAPRSGGPDACRRRHAASTLVLLDEHSPDQPRYRARVPMRK